MGKLALGEGIELFCEETCQTQDSMEEEKKEKREALQHRAYTATHLYINLERDATTAANDACPPTQARPQHH